MVVKQRYSLWCRKYSFMNHVNREPLQTRLENWELHFTLLDHLTDRLLSFLENHHHQIELLVANRCFQCFLDRQPFELTKSDKSMQDKFCSLLGKKWSSNLREIGLERQSRILSADYSLLLPPGSNDKDTPFFTSLPFMNRLKYFICFQQNWLTLHCSWLLGTTSIMIIVINNNHHMMMIRWLLVTTWMPGRVAGAREEGEATRKEDIQTEGRSLSLFFHSFYFHFYFHI